MKVRECILMVILVVANYGYSQDNINDFAKQMDLQNLPGQNGRLVGGFDLLANMPQDLKGFTIKTDSIDMRNTADESKVERDVLTNKFTFTKEGITLVIKVNVAQFSTNDAHIALLDQQINQSGRIGLVRSEQLGISIGDFIFIDDKATATPVDTKKIKRLIFSRNNVSFNIRKTDPNNDSDLVSIARSIDDYLKKQPTYDNLAKSGLLPEIREFELEHDAREVKQQSITPLVVKVRNPVLNEHEHHQEDEDRDERTGKAEKPILKDNTHSKDGMATKDEEKEPSKSIPKELIGATGDTTAKGLILFFDSGVSGTVYREQMPSDTPKVSNVETTRLFFKAVALSKKTGERFINGKIRMYVVTPKLLLMASKEIPVTITE